jgi:hypothetical protein
MELHGSDAAGVVMAAQTPKPQHPEPPLHAQHVTGGGGQVRNNCVRDGRLAPCAVACSKTPRHFYVEQKGELEECRRKIASLIYAHFSRYMTRLLATRSRDEGRKCASRLRNYVSHLEASLLFDATSLEEYQDPKSFDSRLKEATKRVVYVGRKAWNGKRRYWALTLLEQVRSKRCVPRGFEGRRTRARYAMETTGALFAKLAQLDNGLQRYILHFL